MLNQYSNRWRGLVILLFSALSLVGQVSPPARNQQQNNAKPQNKAVQNPPAPTSVTCVCAPPQSSIQSQAPTAEHKTKNWHEWFWPPDWSAWALVVVAIWTAYIALGTLDQIRLETKHSGDLAQAAKGISETARDNAAAAKSAADAARLNAQAVINAERPWIIGLEGEGGYKWGGNDVEIPKFSLEIRNVGRTPARITRLLMNFEQRRSLEDMPAQPYIDVTSILPVPDIFLTNASPSLYVLKALFGNHPLTPDEIQGIRHNKVFPVAYGVIEYRDTFNVPESSHKTNFCFAYAFKDYLHHGFQILYSAPPAYLEMT